MENKEVKQDQQVELTDMQKIHAEVAELVAKYNESAEFAEYKQMKKLDAKISELVEKYTELAELECFKALKQAENPMREAALKLTYETIRTPDRKQEAGGTIRVIENVDKPIDPLRLYKRINNGATPMWSYMIERLNLQYTASVAIGLRIDPQTVRDTMLMSDAAKDVKLMSEADPDKADENAVTTAVMRKDIQSIVDEMIGEGCKILPQSDFFLRAIHTRGGRGAGTVVCSNNRNMRQRMLAVCKAAITQDPCFVMEYKKKKQQ